MRARFHVCVCVCVCGLSRNWVLYVIYTVCRGKGKGKRSPERPDRVAVAKTQIGF
jgi:hypothetical protein